MHINTHTHTHTYTHIHTHTHTHTRISGLLETLADAVADDTNATTDDASDEREELLANISESISAISEREEADKKGMITEYGSWVEDWAKNLLARTNAVKAQEASSAAYVASETSIVKTKLEHVAAGLNDASDQISVRVKRAQVAGADLTLCLSVPPFLPVRPSVPPSAPPPPNLSLSYPRAGCTDRCRYIYIYIRRRSVVYWYSI
jgi:hypothetical protein